MTKTRPGSRPDGTESPTRDLYRAAFAAPAPPTDDRDRAGPGPSPTRQGAALATGLLLLTGMWLVAAPFLLDYVEVGGIDGSWNSVVVGSAVAFLGLLGLSRTARLPVLSLLAAGLGAWLLLAQHVLGYSGAAPRAAVNETTCGIVVIVLALVAGGFALVARAEKAGDRTPEGTRAA